MHRRTHTLIRFCQYHHIIQRSVQSHIINRTRAGIYLLLSRVRGAEGQFRNNQSRWIPLNSAHAVAQLKYKISQMRFYAIETHTL